jgi:hypothetical protein
LALNVTGMLGGGQPRIRDGVEGEALSLTAAASPETSRDSGPEGGYVRVVISFTSPRDPGAFLNPYAVLRAHATIEKGEHAWDLLDRLTRLYLSPDATFPEPRAPGYLVRYRIDRISGVGPWASQ